MILKKESLCYKADRGRYISNLLFMRQISYNKTYYVTMDMSWLV